MMNAYKNEHEEEAARLPSAPLANLAARELASRRKGRLRWVDPFLLNQAGQRHLEKLLILLWGLPMGGRLGVGAAPEAHAHLLQ